MDCKKCLYCIQVSKNKYEVKCDNKKISADPGVWVDEPDFCKYYKDKKSVYLTLAQMGDRLHDIWENYENGRINDDNGN